MQAPVDFQVSGFEVRGAKRSDFQVIREAKSRCRVLTHSGIFETIHP